MREKIVNIVARIEMGGPSETSVQPHKGRIKIKST